MLAVKHLASSLAVEWAKKNVRVNSLRFVMFAVKPVFYISFIRSPGYMRTKMTGTVLEEEEGLVVRSVPLSIYIHIV